MQLTNHRNYSAIVLTGSSTRKQLEDTARKGQKKLADNMKRQVLARVVKWMVCTIAMS
jgi:hypothetical protein